jgi:hypothetical protein
MIENVLDIVGVVVETKEQIRSTGLMLVVGRTILVIRILHI